MSMTNRIDDESISYEMRAITIAVSSSKEEKALLKPYLKDGWIIVSKKLSFVKSTPDRKVYNVLLKRRAD